MLMSNIKMNPQAYKFQILYGNHSTIVRKVLE